MKKRNKSYLLFLYGVWLEDDTFIRDIRDILIYVVDSGYLKFVHGPNSAILSFKSMDEFDDILKYIESSMPDYIENFIFMPKPRKMGYKFPEDMEKHLFDLDTNTNDLIKNRLDDEKDKDISYGTIDDIMNTINNDDDSLEGIIGRIDEMFDSFVNDMKKITKKKSQDLSLDSILDKITEKGVSSLTKEEREFLDNHNTNN